MTALETLAAKDSEFLLIREIAPILGANPQTIRCQAQQRPEMLGFPVIVIGSRVKIPKRPFIQFMTQLQKGEGQ